MTTRRITVALVACLALAAGCATTDPSAEGSGMTTPAGPPSGTPAPTTPNPATPTFTGKPLTPFPGETTVRGTVEEGVEAGCMLLNAENGTTYLLVGGDRATIAKGGRLEAVGKPQPGLMSTCQQGVPFKVTQVRTI